MPAFASLSARQLYTQLNAAEKGLAVDVAEKRAKGEAQLSKVQSWLTGIIAFCITLYLPFSPFAGLPELSVAHMQRVIDIAIIFAFICLLLIF